MLLHQSKREPHLRGPEHVPPKLMPAFLVFLLLFALAAQPAPASTLRIASWNIEHLVSDELRGCRPRSARDFDRVRAVIDQVDADIWLLQEIEGEAALARVFDPAEWVFHVERRPVGSDYPACRGRDDGSQLAMQATAIVVRRGVAHDRLDDVTELDVFGNERMRWGSLIRLREGGDLKVLNVHLKSGCFSGLRAQVCGELFAQLNVLARWVWQRVAAGTPVIIGGDFNRRMNIETDVFWALLNADNDLSIAGAGQRARCIQRYPQFIDFIVFSPDAASRMVAGSFLETTFSGPEAEFPSDHCPISIDIMR